MMAFRKCLTKEYVEPIQVIFLQGEHFGSLTRLLANTKGFPYVHVQYTRKHHQEEKRESGYQKCDELFHLLDWIIELNITPDSEKKWSRGNLIVGSHQCFVACPPKTKFELPISVQINVCSWRWIAPLETANSNGFANREE